MEEPRNAARLLLFRFFRLLRQEDGRAAGGRFFYSAGRRRRNVRAGAVGKPRIDGGGFIDAPFGIGSVLKPRPFFGDPLVVRLGADFFHRLRAVGRGHRPVGRGSRRDLVPSESEIAERIARLLLPIPRKDVAVILLFLFRLRGVFGERIVRSGDVSLRLTRYAKRERGRREKETDRRGEPAGEW